MSISVFLTMIVGALCAAVGYLLAAYRAQKSKAAMAKLEAEKTAADNELNAVKQKRDELDGLLSAERATSNDLQVQNGKLTTELQKQQESFARERAQRAEDEKQLTQQFENLANRIFDEKGKKFSDQSKTNLESILKPFGNQIEAFRKRVDEVHTESTKGNAEIMNGIGDIRKASVLLSTQADDLTSALKGDKKAMGNWGEVQLERTLELSGLIAGDHYEMQDSFKDAEGNRFHPDCVLRLPDQKHIVIDSKVSLVDYNDAVVADNEESMRVALDAHIRAVRNHIDQLSSKDYSKLVGVDSPDFVLMFMPIEAAYIEALKHNRDLFDYGYNKNVIMVSHTTLMPMARTIANLWKLAQSDAEARALCDKAGDIYNKVCDVAERLKKLGGSLQAATGHYNSTLTGLVGQQGLRNKVLRYKEMSVRSTKEFPALESIELLPDIKRLEDDRADADADDSN